MIDGAFISVSGYNSTFSKIYSHMQPTVRSGQIVVMMVGFALVPAGTVLVFISNGSWNTNQINSQVRWIQICRYLHCNIWCSISTFITYNSITLQHRLITNHQTSFLLLLCQVSQWLTLIISWLISIGQRSFNYVHNMVDNEMPPVIQGWQWNATRVIQAFKHINQRHCSDASCLHMSSFSRRHHHHHTECSSF